MFSGQSRYSGPFLLTKFSVCGLSPLISSPTSLSPLPLSIPLTISLFRLCVTLCVFRVVSKFLTRDKTTEIQMLLRKTIHKTKKFFNKTIQSFKTFIFGGYKKLTKAPSLTLFSTNNLSNRKMQHLDTFYKEFCQQWDTDDNNINQDIKVSEKHDIESNTSMVNSRDQGSAASKRVEEQKDVGCSKNVDDVNQSNLLEQKMKELEMMDVKDEEHVLDIEEVLHYYSLLTSPIYQGLVDKFFTDMYSDFNIPQQPVRSDSLNSSIRRLGPLNI